MIKLKFSIERSWIKSVRSAKSKPNYGMTNMDSLLEEMVGNKLEMCGPLIDSYLKEIGKAIGSKLSRSKATSLANPVVPFVPWPVFPHVRTLARGYSVDTTALDPLPVRFPCRERVIIYANSNYKRTIKILAWNNVRQIYLHKLLLRMPF